MALGKQAKTLTETQIKTVLKHLEDSRYPDRDRVMILLSVKAGLRAKEIAGLTWAMVTDAEGVVGDAIHLEDIASKGNGGRTIPLNRELKAAMVAWQASRLKKASPFVITSERDSRMSAGSVTCWFQRVYKALGFDGCSSHSGRRTFVTRAAKAVSQAGGSLRDVQELAGHASLSTTQRYIQGSTDAKKKLVNLI